MNAFTFHRLLLLDPCHMAKMLWRVVVALHSDIFAAESIRGIIIPYIAKHQSLHSSIACRVFAHVSSDAFPGVATNISDRVLAYVVRESQRLTNVARPTRMSGNSNVHPPAFGLTSVFHLQWKSTCIHISNWAWLLLTLEANGTRVLSVEEALDVLVVPKFEVLGNANAP